MDTSFERNNGKDEWLTPPFIIQALGEFDLDPCSPIVRPWDTAKTHYTKKDDGLKKEWFGRVWCNPPYGKETAKWLKKCVEHNNCLVLIFARTETRMFFDYIWYKANALLFIKGRLYFYDITGKTIGAAGAPSVLVAYGEENKNKLLQANNQGKIIGKFIELK